MTSTPKRQESLDDAELKHLLPAAGAPAAPLGRQRQIEEFLMNEITRTPKPRLRSGPRPGAVVGC